jgi:sulfite reductase beta subunit-like hemoprotein
VSHEQNVILPHVRKADLPAVYAALRQAGLATANAGLVSDIIACPGMDYCALATARSIPIAQEISTRFEELKLEREIGPLKIKISGCINACGHHHVGHIGILGLDKAGVETTRSRSAATARPAPRVPPKPSSTPIAAWAPGRSSAALYPRKRSRRSSGPWDIRNPSARRRHWRLRSPP